MAKRRSSEAVPAPDLGYWLRREEWAVIDAALILANVEPRSRAGVRIKKALSITDIEKYVDPVARARKFSAKSEDTCVTDAEAPVFLRALDIHENMWAGIRRGNLSEENHSVVPSEFITWAKSRRYSIPPKLAATLAGRNPRRIELASSVAWRDKQLWTAMEAAHLLSEFEPQPDVRPRDLTGGVASWYRDIKDAVVLKLFPALPGRVPGIAAMLLRPPDVVRWALDHRGYLSPWLANIGPPQPSRAELVARVENLEQQLRLKSASRGPHTEQLEPGERTTLYTLGAYLARKYRFDPDATKNNAIALVQRALEQERLTLSEKTIRKLLRAGSERFPPDKDR